MLRLCGLSCEIVNIGSHSPLLKCFGELYENHFSFRVMFWKSLYWCLAAVQNFKFTHYHQYMHNIIAIIINNFRQEVIIWMTVCFTQHKIFVTTCAFGIQFDKMLPFFFNYTYHSSTSYQLELFNLSPMGHLPAQS